MLTELMTHLTPLVDRRMSPRVKLVCPLEGRILSLNLPVTMIECSEGGFSTTSDRALPVGALYDFRFSTPGQKPMDMTARVVYSLRASARVPSFFTGFAKG